MKRILALATLAAALTAAQPSTASDSALTANECTGASFCDPSCCGPCTEPCSLQ